MFYTYLFYACFWIIYLTNVFIINPKLNVWYFVFSTSTISLKTYLTYMSTNRTDPGRLINTKELDYDTEILKNIP